MGRLQRTNVCEAGLRPRLLHRADQLALQHAQHGFQVATAFEDAPVRANHRILPLAQAQGRAFFDPVEWLFRGAAEG